MVRIGLIGMGFMGMCHYKAYRSVTNASVIALCDTDPQKLSGDWRGVTGNLGGASAKNDIAEIRRYSDMRVMLQDNDIDAVDITLPTHLHKSAVIQALAAGKHVICEKPIARSSEEGRAMIDAAKKYGKHIYVAHCIRFWPSYSTLAELLRKKTYGAVRSALFRRVSPTPQWSDGQWILDAVKSGGAALDLHIHDSDFIRFAIGEPKAVISRAMKTESGRMDHIVTMYEYADGASVTAEGGWSYAKDFPFSMHFVVDCADATLAGDHDSLTVYIRNGGTENIPLPSGDGYERELAHFCECIEHGAASPIADASEALRSLALVEAEHASAGTGSRVALEGGR